MHPVRSRKRLLFVVAFAVSGLTAYIGTIYKYILLDVDPVTPQIRACMCSLQMPCGHVTAHDAEINRPAPRIQTPCHSPKVLAEASIVLALFAALAMLLTSAWSYCGGKNTSNMGIDD